jgi:hypothetical protein
MTSGKSFSLNIELKFVPERKKGKSNWVGMVSEQAAAILTNEFVTFNKDENFDLIINGVIFDYNMPETLLRESDNAMKVITQNSSFVELVSSLSACVSFKIEKHDDISDICETIIRVRELIRTRDKELMNEVILYADSKRKQKVN